MNDGGDYGYGLWPLVVVNSLLFVAALRGVGVLVRKSRKSSGLRYPQRVWFETSVSMNEIAYDVPDMSCQHCVTAVSEELTQLPGVDRVSVELSRKQVVVYGTNLDDHWLRTAIENAGYEAR
jgi:copper chaperone